MSFFLLPILPIFRIFRFSDVSETDVISTMIAMNRKVNRVVNATNPT